MRASYIEFESRLERLMQKIHLEDGRIVPDALASGVANRESDKEILRNYYEEITISTEVALELLESGETLMTIDRESIKSVDGKLYIERNGKWKMEAGLIFSHFIDEDLF